MLDPQVKQNILHVLMMNAYKLLRIAQETGDNDIFLLAKVNIMTLFSITTGTKETIEEFVRKSQKDMMPMVVDLGEEILGETKEEPPSEIPEKLKESLDKLKEEVADDQLNNILKTLNIKRPGKN